MKVNAVAAFDFDGTITRKDTLLEFIRFAKGSRAFYIGFLFYAPILIAYKLKLYPNWKAKQKIFAYFFKGMPLNEFDLVCECFFIEVGRKLLYSSAEEQIRKHLDRNDEVVIISASVENWIRPFSRYLGIKHVLGTSLEVDNDNHLTGNFSTPNCYGSEKVNRLKNLYSNRDNYYLIAYGDSRGDFELLTYADEKKYKMFKQ